MANVFIRAVIGATLAAGSVSSALAQGAYPGSGPQPVSRGATGRAALTQNNLIFGNGVSPVGFIAPGTNGRCLLDNGTIWTPGFCVTSSGAAATGTSGHAVPFLDGANLFSALQAVSLNASSLPAAQVGALLRLAQADGVSARLQMDSFAAAGLFSCARADGTNGSKSAVGAGDEICSFNSFGYNGTGYVGPAAALRSYAAETWLSGHQGTYWRFATTANGSTTLTDRIGIENDGGITVPPSVTGGSMGVGTINVGGGYSIGGVPLAAIYSLSGSFTLPSGVLTLQPSGASTLGGVNSIAQVAHQWVQYIDTAGLPHLAQPSFADLATGTASCAQLPALTGTVTTAAGSCNTAIANAALSYAMIQNVAASRLWGNPTGSPAAGSDISLGATLSFVGSALQTVAGTGDVAWAANSFSNSINAAAVTFAKFQNIAALSMFGNCSNASGSGGNVTGIANQVLRVNGAGTSCGFGAIDLSQSASVANTLPFTNLPTLPADNLAGNPTAGTAIMQAIALVNCSNALTYNTSTHAFGCNATAGTGNVSTSGTPVAGQIAVWTSASAIQGVNPPTLHTSFGTFTTSASSTTSTVYEYEITGAGAGGAGAVVGQHAGAGGGSGETRTGTFSGVGPSVTVTLSAGAGGTAGTNTGGTGGTGGSTTLSATGMSTVTAIGGTGGITDNVNAGGAGGTGGAGGQGIPGGQGQGAMNPGSTLAIGGGGGTSYWGGGPSQQENGAGNSNGPIGVGGGGGSGVSSAVIGGAGQAGGGRIRWIQ